MKIATVSNKQDVMLIEGESIITGDLVFNGSHEDLPPGRHGVLAYCFNGTDKGKVFVYDEEAEAWVDQSGE